MARRAIALTVVAIAMAVSLGFATSAQGAVNAEELRADCEAAGGEYRVWTEKDGYRHAECSFELCEDRYIRIGGLIKIPYKYCYPFTKGIAWHPH